MKKRSNLKVMRQLVSLVRPLTGFMVLAVFMGLAGHLCASWITILGGYGVLSLLGFALPVSLNILFVCLLIFALLRGILRYAEQACNHFIAFKLLALIRDKVFGALRKLCPAKLEGKNKGDLIAVITSDIELLEVFYAHTISPIAIAVLFCLIMCLFIGSYHWMLGGVALAAYLTVGVLIPVITSKQSKDAGLRFRRESGELSSFVLDSLRGLSEIQQYGMGAERLAQMNQKTDSLAEVEEGMKKRSGRNTAVTNTAILLFDLLMLGAAGMLYTKGILGFDGMLISVIALFSSFGPAVALAALGSTLQNTFAAGNRVLDILEEEPVVSEVSGQKRTGFSGAAAEHVSFSYGEGAEAEQILSDVSVVIPQYSVVGIVGKSGSGKSTLLKLFMRFWEVQKGQIQLSGVPVSEIDTDHLRTLEGFVTQETHLFHDSIRNNLRIAKPDASQEELEEACKKASVHDFIMSLPKGYDTPVGELGDTLSGGERQRIGLARAFLHNAPFLLLDEPTSNLDSLNEAVILRALCKERDGKTVVLVSHRESTMGIADKVYSVEHGRMS